MIHIAICDDEKEFVQDFDTLLKQYAAESGELIKLSAFYDGMELIDNYDHTIDLIFLDVKMKMVNGFQAAKQIRKIDEKVGIIFLTTLSQYGLEGYKYQATNYIIKPLKYIRLKVEMDNFIQRHQNEDDPFLFIANDLGKYKIFLKKLRFIETSNRNLLFHTEPEDVICYQKMKEIEENLSGKGFVRCHNSYIVNLFFVKDVKKLNIELITGEIIPLSQPRRKEFMEKLAKYWGDML